MELIRVFDRPVATLSMDQEWSEFTHIFTTFLHCQFEKRLMSYSQ